MQRLTINNIQKKTCCTQIHYFIYEQNVNQSYIKQLQINAVDTVSLIMNILHSFYTHKYKRTEPCL